MPVKQKKNLGELMAGIPYHATKDIHGISITGIVSDSRHIKKGNLFIAIKGMTVDGHTFVNEAVKSGCTAVIIERGRKIVKPASETVFIEVPDSKVALGMVAASYYDHPGRKAKMIAITGTNGKTTTSYLIESIIRATGKRPGVIGTVSYRYYNNTGKLIEQSAPFTTPEPITLQNLLKNMVDDGVTHVIMEVSSHALALKRISGLFFDIAVFTNLSRDHLDFHCNMEDYYKSKKLLFSNYLKPEGKAVIVLESDPKMPSTRNGKPTSCWGQKLRVDLDGSTNKEADIYPEKYSFNLDGINAVIVTPQNRFSLKSPLAGEFNLKNILAATGVGLFLSAETNDILSGLEKTAVIPGRLEQIKAKKGTNIFVDYAHTPDALENVCNTLRKLNPTRLVCIFGCGGDRDKGKRPLMGNVAGRLCDVVLITSDNPRTESPEKILDEIESGLAGTSLRKHSAEKLLKDGNSCGYDVIASRGDAIRIAVQNSGPEDIILISGKGHECYQITGNDKIYFDDRVEAAKYLNGVYQ